MSDENDKKLPAHVSSEPVESPPKLRKKPGRKKGVRLEVANLGAGGIRGRRIIDTKEDEPPWNLYGMNNNVEKDDDDDDSDFSVFTESSIDTDDFEDLEEDEANCCVDDMNGNRLIPIDKLAYVMRNNVCCRRCAALNHTKEVKRFLSFAEEYEKKVDEDEKRIVFESRLQQVEWRISKRKTAADLYKIFLDNQQEQVIDRICCDFVVCEETFGFATTVYGTCKRERHAHTFQIVPQMVGSSIRKNLHKNMKSQQFAINYQLCAAIQQMGCGPSDAIMLSGFLDISSGDKIKRALQQVEKILGPVEEKLKEECEIDAVNDEVRLARENNDLEMHECNMHGYEHKPLPKLKISYGKI